MICTSLCLDFPRITSVRFVYGMAGTRSVFSLFAVPQFTTCWCHDLFIFSPVHGHLGCFSFEARINKAAVNLNVLFCGSIFYFSSICKLVFLVEEIGISVLEECLRASVLRAIVT